MADARPGARQVSRAHAVALARWTADCESIGGLAGDAYDGIRTRFKHLCAQWEAARLRAAAVDREVRAVRDELARRRAKPRPPGGAVDDEWRRFADRMQEEQAELKRRQQEAAQEIGRMVRHWEAAMGNYTQCWQRAPTLLSDEEHQRRIQHYYQSERDTVKHARAVTDPEDNSVRLHVDDMCATGHLIRERLREWLNMHADEKRRMREAAIAKATQQAAAADDAARTMEEGAEKAAEGSEGSEQQQQPSDATTTAIVQSAQAAELELRHLEEQNRREPVVPPVPEPLANDIEAAEVTQGKASGVRAEADAQLIDLWRRQLDPVAVREMQEALVSAQTTARGAAAGSEGGDGTPYPKPQQDGGLGDPAYAVSSEGVRAALAAADSIERLYSAHSGQQRVLAALAMGACREPLEAFQGEAASSAAAKLLEAEERTAAEKATKAKRKKEKERERARKETAARAERAEAAAQQKQEDAVAVPAPVAQQQQRQQVEGSNGSVRAPPQGTANGGSEQPVDAGRTFLARELEAAARMEAALLAADGDEAAISAALASAGGADWEDAGASRRRGGRGAGREEGRSGGRGRGKSGRGDGRGERYQRESREPRAAKAAAPRAAKANAPAVANAAAGAPAHTPLAQKSAVAPAAAPPSQQQQQQQQQQEQVQEQEEEEEEDVWVQQEEHQHQQQQEQKQQEQKQQQQRRQQQQQQQQQQEWKGVWGVPPQDTAAARAAEHVAASEPVAAPEAPASATEPSPAAVPSQTPASKLAQLQPPPSQQQVQAHAQAQTAAVPRATQRPARSSQQLSAAAAAYVPPPHMAVAPIASQPPMVAPPPPVMPPGVPPAAAGPMPVPVPVPMSVPPMAVPGMMPMPAMPIQFGSITSDFFSHGVAPPMAAVPMPMPPVPGAMPVPGAVPMPPHAGVMPQPPMPPMGPPPSAVAGAIPPPPPLPRAISAAELEAKLLMKAQTPEVVANGNGAAETAPAPASAQEGAPAQAAAVPAAFAPAWSRPSLSRKVIGAPDAASDAASEAAPEAAARRATPAAGRGRGRGRGGGRSGGNRRSHA